MFELFEESSNILDSEIEDDGISSGKLVAVSDTESRMFSLGQIRELNKLYFLRSSNG